MADFLDIEKRFEEILRAEPVRYSITSEVDTSSKYKLQHQKSKLLIRASSKIFGNSPTFSEEVSPVDTKTTFKQVDLTTKCALNKLLLEAVRYRDVDAIEKLLVADASANATCSTEHISASHLAALRPDAALSVLLAHGARSTSADLFGHTPLHIAAWAGNTRQLAMLLGFHEDMINKMGSATINAVVEEEVRNMSQLLCDVVNAQCTVSAARPDLPREWADSTIEHNCMDFVKSLPLLPAGSTPLHAACVRAKSQCIRLLLAAGADPNLQDEEGNTPLDVLGSAFYSDDYIDRVSFTDSVKVLIAARAQCNAKNSTILDTPLHVAVELNSLEAASALQSLIPVSKQNQAGLTPLHICIKKRLREIFHVLIYDKLELENNNKVKSAADVRDSGGLTALHAAIAEGWEQGVYAAVDANANVLARTHNEDTCLHLAAAAGNIEILNKIIDITRKAFIIDKTNSKHETPLIKAVQHGHAKCVKRLLEENASPKKALSFQINVLHIATENGHFDILKVLLENNNVKDMINNISEDQNGFGPIHYAVHNDHPQCLKLLLANNACKSLKTSVTGVYQGATALHLAAIHNNIEIAKILAENDPYTINNVNSVGWTPLHTACCYGHREIIVLLLKHNADLSAIATDQNEKTKVTAIDLLMNNLSKPTEFLVTFFDTCISMNGVDIQDPKCEITVDYRVLAPTAEGREQIKVLKALVETGNTSKQLQLLLHPLLESFLYLKWKAVLPFVYTIIVVYAVFVLTLSTYVSAVFLSRDIDVYIKSLNVYTLAIMVYISASFVLILEVFYVTVNMKFFMKFENWIKFGALVLALSLPSAINNLRGDPENQRHIATLALLLAWLEMSFLVSKLPKWGYYVFGKALKNVLKILLTFSCLVIGFALSFMIQFHHQSDFNGPLSAIVRVFVMMTSDLNYDDLLEQKKDSGQREDFTGFTKVIISPILIFRLMFISFVILTHIVLMNLMIGVAVSDLRKLEVLGNITKLSKQIEFLDSFDTSLYNRYFRRCLPNPLEKIISKKKTISSIMKLYPSDPRSKFYKSLPFRIINSILENAQSHTQQIDNEMGNLRHKKRTNEIYYATNKVKSDKDFDKHNNKCKEIDDNDKNESDVDKIMKINNVNPDASLVETFRQTSEVLNEMRTAITHLEIKMITIYNEYQNNKYRK